MAKSLVFMIMLRLFHAAAHQHVPQSLPESGTVIFHWSIFAILAPNFDSPDRSTRFPHAAWSRRSLNSYIVIIIFRSICTAARTAHTRPLAGPNTAESGQGPELCGGRYEGYAARNAQPSAQFSPSRCAPVTSAGACSTRATWPAAPVRAPQVEVCSRCSYEPQRARRCAQAARGHSAERTGTTPEVIYEPCDDARSRGTSGRALDTVCADIQRVL